MKRAADWLRSIWEPHTREFRVRAAFLFTLVGVFALVKLLSGSGDGAKDEAISYAPAASYAYVHVALADGAEQTEDAAEVFARLPSSEAIAQGLFSELSGLRGVDLREDVLSWTGDEAALAVVPGSVGRPEPVLIAAVADEGGADEFAVRVAGQPTGERTLEGREAATHRGGLVSLQDSGFLLLGPQGAVSEALAAKDDSDAALGADEVATGVRESLAEDRVADAFVSQDGLAGLEAAGGVGATLDTFADAGASRGLAAALLADEEGLEVEMSSELDPARAEAEPGFISAFPAFGPSLAELLAPGTVAMIGAGEPATAVRGLLERADAVAPGIAVAFDRLDAQLQRTGGVDLLETVLPALGDEMALGLAPAPDSGPGRELPFVTAAFGGVDEGRARAAVASLAGPLLASVNPAATGRVPTVEEATSSGVPVVRISITPELTVTIGALDGRLLVTTDPRGVRRVAEGGEGLDADEGFRAVGGVPSDEVSALVFLDLDGLIALGEPLGLAGIRNYSRFREDFERLGAMGITIRSGDDSLDTEISLQIDQGDDQE